MTAFALTGSADFFAFLQASGLLMSIFYPLIAIALFVAYFFIHLFF